MFFSVSEKYTHSLIVQEVRARNAIEFCRSAMRKGGWEGAARADPPNTPTMNTSEPASIHFRHNLVGFDNRRARCGSVQLQNLDPSEEVSCSHFPNCIHLDVVRKGLHRMDWTPGLLGEVTRDRLQKRKTTTKSEARLIKPPKAR